MGSIYYDAFVIMIGSYLGNTLFGFAEKDETGTVGFVLEATLCACLLIFLFFYKKG